MLFMVAGLAVAAKLINDLYGDEIEATVDSVSDWWDEHGERLVKDHGPHVVHALTRLMH